MNRSLIRRLVNAEFENLLAALSSRQHLGPHEPLASALARVVKDLSVCPTAVQDAINWLRIDPATSIGRLRRTELMQLARSIHRFWRQRRVAAPLETR